VRSNTQRLPVCAPSVPWQPYAFVEPVEKDYETSKPPVIQSRVAEMETDQLTVWVLVMEAEPEGLSVQSVVPDTWV
jgi:hypothetical protein